MATGSADPSGPCGGARGRDDPGIFFVGGGSCSVDDIPGRHLRLVLIHSHLQGESRMKDLVFTLYEQLESQRKTTDQVLKMQLRMERDGEAFKAEKEAEERRRQEEIEQMLARQEWQKEFDREEKDRLLAEQILQRENERIEREIEHAEEIWQRELNRLAMEQRIAEELQKLEKEREIERIERRQDRDRVFAEQVWEREAEREEKDRVIAEQLIQKEAERMELEVLLAEQLWQRHLDHHRMEDRLAAEREERQQSLDSMLAEQLSQRAIDQEQLKTQFNEQLARIEEERRLEQEANRREIDLKIREATAILVQEREEMRLQVEGMRHTVERQTSTIWHKNGAMVGVVIGGVFVILCVSVSALSLGIGE